MIYDMQLVRQPEGSNQCGQCCVAMVANVSRLRSIQAFGTAGKTSWKQVRAALRKLGVKHGELKRGSGFAGARKAIVRVWMAKHHTHFVVWSFGSWWCPTIGYVEDIKPAQWPDDAHVTGWLEIL